MTPEELFRRANEEMTRCYKSCISCMDTADSMRSIRFFRDYTEGEIDAITFFSQTMYLAIIYNHENTDKAAESRSYMNYCNIVRERSKELKNLIIEYASEIISENIVE